MIILDKYLKDDVFKVLYPQIVVRGNQNLGDGVIPTGRCLRLKPIDVFDEISRWTNYLSDPNNEYPENINLYDHLRIRYLAYETCFLCALIYLTAKYKGIITERHNLFFMIGLQRVCGIELNKDEYISLVERKMFAEISYNTPQIEMNWREKLNEFDNVQEKKDYLHSYIINTKQTLSNDMLEIMELELKRLEQMNGIKNIIDRKAVDNEHSVKKRKSFRSVIQADDKEKFLQRLHQIIDGKGGKDVAAALYQAKRDGYITRYPTKAEYEAEFVLVGCWQGIYKHLGKGDSNDMLIAGSSIIFK